MRLLAPGEGAPAIVQNPGAASPLVLIADHMGRQIPGALGDLGLPAEDLVRHIAWDIGVGGVGRRLARRLDACLIGQRYSRLVIDCNRSPAQADAIPEVSDGARIPANADLDARHAQLRLDEIFTPYHAAIAAELDARTARGQQPVIVALHSFTPAMQGQSRPWRFGVLHDRPSPFCRAVLRRLRADLGEALVGDNQPYAMDGIDFTVPHHAGGRGLDYLELEIRQDLIEDEAGQAEVAAWLAPHLTEALGELG